MAIDATIITIDNYEEQLIESGYIPAEELQ